MSGPTAPDASQEPRSLTSQTLAGVRWTYLASIVNGVLQIGFAAIMGRLLDPAAFGLVALAMLALRFGTFFARMGVAQALIQKEHLSERDIRAGFTSSVLFSTVVYIGVWFAAPIAGLFFTEPDVVPVLRAIGLTMILTGLGTTADSLLRRELRFRSVAVREIVSHLFGYMLVGVVLAVLGFGVWSLVGASLASGILVALLSYAAVRHSLRPMFHWQTHRRLLGFGSRVTVISFFEFLGNNLDTIAVGRYLTAALVGQYNRAFILVNLPLTQLTTNLSKVLFPSFSRIQAEGPRVKRAYLSAIGMAAAVLFPITAGMGVASFELVRVIIGPQWDQAAAILPIFAAAAALHFLSHFAGVVCEALAELNRKLALQLTTVALLGILLLAAIDHGLWAFAAALAAAELVRHFGYVLLTRSVLGIAWRELAGVYLPALLSAAVVGGVNALVRRGLLAADAPLAAVLIAQILLGAVLLYALFRFGPLKTVRIDVGKRLRGAGALGTNETRRSRMMHAALGVPPTSPPSVESPTS